MTSTPASWLPYPEREQNPEYPLEWPDHEIEYSVKFLSDERIMSNISESKSSAFVEMPFHGIICPATLIYLYIYVY